MILIKTKKKNKQNVPGVPGAGEHLVPGTEAEGGLVGGPGDKQCTFFLEITLVWGKSSLFNIPFFFFSEFSF